MGRETISLENTLYPYLKGNTQYAKDASEKRKAIREFNKMSEMAELKALSKVSLERPLTEREYKRFTELGRKRGLITKVA